MSTASITGTAVRDLAARITRELDADKDVKLSATEFEGIGVVDLIQSAGLGGRAWQWLPVD